MNKSLMISIQPKHVVNILNGTKTLELRKTVPKDYKGWVYIYCTKGGGVLVDNTSWINYLIKNGFVEKDYTESPRFHTLKKLEQYMYGSVRNTKVVARFWFDEYETIPYEVTLPRGHESFDGEWIDYSLYGYWTNATLLERSCLNDEEISIYGKGKDIYAWHIEQLEIFDKPMELSDFYKATLYATGQVIEEYEKRTNDFKSYRLQRSPQSWQYVYTRE